MKKTLRAGALALVLAAAFAGSALYTMHTAERDTAVIVAQAATTLRKGSSGETVRRMQTKLIRWGYLSGQADGIFGSKTEQAVRLFQSKNGLKVDGVAGPATFKALGMTEEAGSSSSSSSSSTESDTYLLARCIYGEARGESYTGQVAVGAVVLNRVESAQFPNTIAGVIYQRHAFTAVSDGQINLTPDETAISAARDALNGWDPTGGCLYYYNPATATSEWIFSREVVVTIGRHVFAI